MEGCCIWNFSLTFVFVLSAILCIKCDIVRNYKEAACHDHERDALIKFRSGLEYDSHHQVASWDQSTGDCCKWRGVGCDTQTGYVLQLHLFPNLQLDDHGYYSDSINKTGRLSGHLDPALLKLEYLQFLDLSGNAFIGIPIPEFLGSFKDLLYLNLSYSYFVGQIPHQLGNLSNLEQLEIHGLVNDSDNYLLDLKAKSLHWLKGMPMLKILSMKSVNLSEIGNDWIQALNDGLPSLQELELSSCELRGIAPTITSINFNSLRKLHLPYNDWFVQKIPSWITNISSLESINLRSNGFHGQLPSSIGDLTSLIELDLSYNNIEKLPETVTKPCTFFVNKGSYCDEITPLPNLRVLNLRYNTNMSGAIPDWLWKFRSLEVLDMSYCNLSGPIPSSIGDLSSLRILNLKSNHLSGIFPIISWNFSRLEQLSLGSNWLTGDIADAQLNQLKNLTSLNLSSNSFVFDIASHWDPPFQLELLDLKACSLGPSFPQWLITQKSLRTLVLSNTSIEDSLPPWFWDFASPLEWLDLSSNKIKGLLPKTWNCTRDYFNFDLSNNQFSGPLPQTYFTPLPIFFSISENQITGAIPKSICDIKGVSSVIHLSQNYLVGNIPAGLGNCSTLFRLDLSKNYLEGEIPCSLSKPTLLESLRLADNKLSGTIPLSLRNASALVVLDLGENNLSGNLLPLVYNTGLEILRLSSNKFTGALPPNFSRMDRLQILDLSDNMLSGLIPKSIGKFTALTKVPSRSSIGYPWIGIVLIFTSSIDKLWLSFKGNNLLYDKNLGLVAGIDLSRNDFYGEIPKELTRLKGLEFLNLSNNHFTGAIPENIGELRRLESLDISCNQLEGEIPPSLLQLTFLAKLNLSNNHLRGMIPFGGQLQILGDPSIYEGNIGLCGPPLEKQCVAAIDTVPTTPNLEHGREDGRWLYMGMMLGFVFGFWVFWGLLIFNKSMRIAFYEFFDVMMDKLFLLIVISLAKVKTKA